jgi:hypothetical protein
MTSKTKVKIPNRNFAQEISLKENYNIHLKFWVGEQKIKPCSAYFGVHPKDSKFRNFEHGVYQVGSKDAGRFQSSCSSDFCQRRGSKHVL